MKTKTYNSIGKRFKKIRQEQGLTLEKCAEILEVSVSTVQRLEKDKLPHTLLGFAKFCIRTNTSADYLLFGNDNKLPDDIKDLVLELAEKIKSGQ